MKNKISPSVMCMDSVEYLDTLDTFENNKIEYLHVDIMDGIFVPNYTLGIDYCKNLKKYSNIPLDLHLMIENPENKLQWFPISDGDYVSVHIESTKHIQKALSQIRLMNGKPMVALNPATPICMLDYILPDIDGVLLMTVNPGFAGQKLIPETLKKISDLRNYLDKNNYNNIEIEVDGNVSFDNAEKMKNCGANIFVVGTSSIFGSSLSLNDSIKKFREIIN